MKKKQIRTLYNRALSMALAVSTALSFCLGVSGVTAAMEEQKNSEETQQTEIIGEKHHHTFGCYEEYRLDCTENHLENEHRESCYTYSGEQICGLEEGELHLHGAECEAVARVLICEEWENSQDEAEESLKEMDSDISKDEEDEKELEEAEKDREEGEKEESSKETDNENNVIEETTEDRIEDNIEETREDNTEEITEDDTKETAEEIAKETTEESIKESDKEEATKEEGADEETRAEDGTEKETTGNISAGEESAEEGTKEEIEKEETTEESGKKETTENTEKEDTDEKLDEGNTEDKKNQGESGRNEEKNTEDLKSGIEQTEGENRVPENAKIIKDTEPVKESGAGNDGSTGGNDGSIDGSGENTDGGVENSGTGEVRFSLHTTNNHTYSHVFLPQLYIESPLNYLVDTILYDEDGIEENKEDNINIENENRIDDNKKNTITTNNTEDPGEEEKITGEGEITDELDKEHHHSENCYKTVYQCRQGIAMMALEDGGVSNEEDLKKIIDQASGMTTIYIANDFPISKEIEISTGKNIVIDLQGNTLSFDKANSTNTTNAMFKVMGGTLTIKDSVHKQQNARLVTERIVNEAGEVNYDNQTGLFTYYVTKCTVNFDGKSTTNTVWEYTYDLGTGSANKESIGTLDGTNLTSIIIISTEGGSATIQGGRLTGCDGSAILADAGSVNISGGYIEQCGQTNNDGGAIRMESGGLTVSGGVIANNIGHQGGAIKVLRDVTATINGGMIVNNTASINGGGIYAQNAILNISGNTVIAGNQADGFGGAITVFGSISAMKCISGHIAGNHAKKNGGGIYFADSKTDNNNRIAIDAIITENTADQDGGGIYIENSKLILGKNADETLPIIEGNLNEKREDNTCITANTAVGQVGGIYLNDASNTMLELRGKVIVAANRSANEDNNSIYPMNKVISPIPTTCYIEQEQEDADEIIVNSYETLKKAVFDSSKSTNKHIQLSNTIEMKEKIEIRGDNHITLLLNGYDIEPAQGYLGDCLFLVNGENSSLTIKNKADESMQQPVQEEVNGNAAGRAGIYDQENAQLTYYVTKSTPQEDVIHTKETTYRYTINLRDIDNPMGRLKGNGIDAVICANNQGRVIVEGGIITGALHGLKLNGGAAMLMRGGYILGCGSAVQEIDQTGKEGTSTSPQDGAGVYAVDAAGIQMFDGVIAGNSTPKSGGGIFADRSSVEIKGGVIAANIAGNTGGGICAQNTEVILGDKVKNENTDSVFPVISGNTARALECPPEESAEHRQSRHYGGGGVFTDATTKLSILYNAYITHNRAEGTPGQGSEGVQDGAGVGGGGVFSSGEVVMSGSYVTANYSNASGGGIFSYAGRHLTGTTYSGSMTLTGGIIAGNYAVHNEGGGIRIDHKGRIESENGNKIYLTNNQTDTTTNWGGGGLFNTSGSDTTIQSVLITDNTAAGFGGGIAGCNHGTNQFFVNHGAGIFDNRAMGTSVKLQGDTFVGFAKNDKKNYADRIDVRTPVVQEGEAEIGNHPLFIDYKNEDTIPSYQDFYCSNISQVYGSMLGDGSANWRGSGSNSSKLDENPLAFPIEIAEGSFAETSNLMGLTAHPSEEDKNKAKAKAEVYITGNHSAAHGAGVMTNGRFIIGISENKEAGSLAIEKKIQDINGAEMHPDNTQVFQFLVTLMDTEGAALSGTYSYTKEPFNTSLDMDVDETGKSINGIAMKVESVSSGEGEANSENQVKITPAKISLRPGQKLTISGLPNGTYEITEEVDEHSPYESKNEENIKQGVIWADNGRNVLFVNVPKPSLRIRKLLQDDSGANEDNRLFGFTIKMTDKEGNYLNGTYSYSKDPFSQTVDGGMAKGKITFTEGESEKIWLRNGQTISLYGLPHRAGYRIIEAPDDKYEAMNGKYEQSGEIQNQIISLVTFTNVPKPDDPTKPEESSSQEETTGPDTPEEPKDPEDPKEPEEPKDPDNPKEPSSSETSNETEKPNPSEESSSQENPTSSTTSSGGGGGGNRTNEPGTSPQTTTVPSTETLPVSNTETVMEPLSIPETPLEPGMGIPQYPTELPDPNDPNSPDTITIMEDDVPRTYIKVWDPETEEFVYLPEDEVPLAAMLPQTGDTFNRNLWRFMFILSLISTAVLLCLKKIENRRQKYL